MRRTIHRTEAELEKLNAAFDRVRTALAAPELYEADSKNALFDLQTRYSELERDIERAEAVWLTASQALEQAGT